MLFFDILFIGDVMKTEDVLIDGEVESVVVELPDEVKEDYFDDNLDDTIEINLEMDVDDE